MLHNTTSYLFYRGGRVPGSVEGKVEGIEDGVNDPGRMGEGEAERDLPFGGFDVKGMDGGGKEGGMGRVVPGSTAEETEGEVVPGSVAPESTAEETEGEVVPGSTGE